MLQRRELIHGKFDSIDIFEVPKDSPGNIHKNIYENRKVFFVL